MSERFVLRVTLHLCGGFLHTQLNVECLWPSIRQPASRLLTTAAGSKLVLSTDHKLPILLEVNRDDGDDESLMREEIEEFIELLEDAPNKRNRRRVEKHLRSTRFIITAQLPTADIDEDGYAALGHFLTYFVNNNGAMIQADGEGFYEGEKVIVELD